MKKKDCVKISIDNTEEFSSIDELLENLKTTTLQKFHDKVKYLSQQYQNVQITGISVSSDEDWDEYCDEHYSHEWAAFAINYERDETPKEEKKRLSDEAKEAARKLKEKEAKKEKKLKEKENEYNMYLTLKRKYEKDNGS